MRRAAFISAKELNLQRHALYQECLMLIEHFGKERRRLHAGMKRQARTKRKAVRHA